MRNMFLFSLSAVGLATVALAPDPGRAAPPMLTTLANFSGLNGWNPAAGLIADTDGNLFGTTLKGGCERFRTPGSADCYGESVLALLQQDQNLDVAAAALGLSGAEALQTATSGYCGTLAP